MLAVKLIFLICITGLLAAQVILPMFDDYPSELWTGHAAPVSLHSRLEHAFQTRLRDAAKQPPNFAGHYRFVLWGCGSNCVSGAIVDLKTGEVLQSPMASSATGHWNVCQSAFSDVVADFRKDSRLLVIQCGKTWIDRIQENVPDLYYFDFKDRLFNLIFHSVPRN